MERLRTLLTSIIEGIKPYAEALQTYLMEKPDSSEEDAAIARQPIRWGLVALGLFFGVFGLWGLLAPISSAAVAPGQVSLDLSKKTIQHLEGGIIDEILVKDGDMVKKGQALIRLSETAAQANLNLLKKQHWSLMATLDRLQAEQDGKKGIAFNAKLPSYKTNPDVQKIMAGEKRLFRTRTKALNGKIKVLKQKIVQSKKESEGLQAQKNSAEKQLSLLQDDLKTNRELFAQGYVSKDKVVDLERQIAHLEGNRGEFVAKLAENEQIIAETQLEILNIKNARLNEIVAEMQEVRTKSADLEERIIAASDTRNRLAITAPEDGIVNGLKVHTVGGVIAPGSEIMDLVPQNDKLIIESRVSPLDIDSVHSGLHAKVRLSAFKAKKVPMVRGVVVHVSADKFQDQYTGQPYYLAKIELDSDSLRKLQHVQLSPGMPAETLIVTGRRTFWSYFFSPITDVLHKAFREE